MTVRARILLPPPPPPPRLPPPASAARHRCRRRAPARLYLIQTHAGTILGDNFSDKPLLQRLNWVRPRPPRARRQPSAAAASRSPLSSARAHCSLAPQVHVPLLLITPLIALYGLWSCYWIGFDVRTVAFSVFYYFWSACAALSLLLPRQTRARARLSLSPPPPTPHGRLASPPSFSARRPGHHGGLPPAVCAQELHCGPLPAGAAGADGQRRRRGLRQVVVARPPRAPPLRRHAARPLRGHQGLLVRAHWLDAGAAGQGPHRPRRGGRCVQCCAVLRCAARPRSAQQQRLGTRACTFLFSASLPLPPPPPLFRRARQT